MKVAFNEIEINGERIELEGTVIEEEFDSIEVKINTGKDTIDKMNSAVKSKTPFNGEDAIYFFKDGTEVAKITLLEKAKIKPIKVFDRE
ncbi:MAG: hypothetical protein ACTIDE_01700 [Carnobacterium maltaromaticum]